MLLEGLAKRDGADGGSGLLGRLEPDRNVRSFVTAVKTGGAATIPSSQIIYNQAIIDGIVKSNAVGHEIPVEIPEI